MGDGCGRNIKCSPDGVDRGREYQKKIPTRIPATSQCPVTNHTTR